MDDAGKKTDDLLLDEGYTTYWSNGEILKADKFQEQVIRGRGRRLTLHNFQESPILPIHEQPWGKDGSGVFAVSVGDDTERSGQGWLDRPRILWILLYDKCQAYWFIEQISWELAEFIDPVQLRSITAMLHGGIGFVPREKRHLL